MVVARQPDDYSILLDTTTNTYYDCLLKAAFGDKYVHSRGDPQCCSMTRAIAAIMLYCKEMGRWTDFSLDDLVGISHTFPHWPFVGLVPNCDLELLWTEELIDKAGGGGYEVTQRLLDVMDRALDLIEDGWKGL